MPSGTHSSQHPLGIGGAILRINQEMKRRAIVPHLVELRWLPGRHVGGDPLDLCATRAEPCLRHCECLVGEVENGDLLKSSIKKSIDQS